MKFTETSLQYASLRATAAFWVIAGLFCFAIIANTAHAQIAGQGEDVHVPPPAISFLNFDDHSTGWLLCTGPSCAGGSGNPTCEIQTFNNNPPSLDGGSMKLEICGPAHSNNGWYYNTGADDTATTFTLDMYFNIPSKTYAQALEFDQFQYLLAGHGGVTSNTRLYFGTECVTGGDWDVWDSSGKGWIHTGKSCSYTVSSTAFNHLVIKVHRVSGDTSCSGRPCMYYTITLNSASIVTNYKTSSGALPAGWGEQTGLMLQLDTNSTCGSACTVTEYVDKGNFTSN